MESLKGTLIKERATLQYEIPDTEYDFVGCLVDAWNCSDTNMEFLEWSGMSERDFCRVTEPKIIGRIVKKEC